MLAASDPEGLEKEVAPFHPAHVQPRPYAIPSFHDGTLPARAADRLSSIVSSKGKVREGYSSSSSGRERASSSSSVPCTCGREAAVVGSSNPLSLASPSPFRPPSRKRAHVPAAAAAAAVERKEQKRTSTIRPDQDASTPLGQAQVDAFQHGRERGRINGRVGESEGRDFQCEVRHGGQGGGLRRREGRKKEGRGRRGGGSSRANGRGEGGEKGGQGVESLDECLTDFLKLRWCSACLWPCVGSKSPARRQLTAFRICAPSWGVRSLTLAHSSLIFLPHRP